jgi:hypothetical protein
MIHDQNCYLASGCVKLSGRHTLHDWSQHGAL